MSRVAACLAGIAVALAGAAPAGAATFFKSPSGNIGCAMQAKLGVRCDILKRDWRPPPKPESCPGEYGNGVFVGPRGPGTYTCATDTVIGAGRTLGYGRSVSRGRYRCTSRSSGIRCVNRRNDHGFKLSRQRVRLF
jgi:hypothetical protein